MARTAITRPRRPVLPSTVSKAYMRRVAVAVGSKVAPYAATLHVDPLTGTRTIWLQLNGILYKSLDDGATFLNARGTASEITVKSGLLGWEGMFASSAGRLFLATGADQKIYYKGLQANGTDLEDSTSPFSTVTCNDGVTEFVFPAGTTGAATGSHFTRWSIWEIEYPWEAVGSLEVGDIVVGQYHRSSNGTRVTYIAIVDGGSGYLGGESGTFELVLTGGAGSGAAYTAVVTNGVITGITYGSGGSGYTSAPTVDAETNGAREGGRAATLTAYVLCRAAHLYVIRGTSINADPTTMFPSTDTEDLGGAGLLGDPFVAWNDISTGMSRRVRHIHHVTMGTDGWLYFTCGDDASGIPWATGDSGNHYRHCRIYPQTTAQQQTPAPWEQLAGAGNGFTGVLLRDDGTRVMGNDTSSYWSGQTQYIERWSGASKIDRPYTPAGIYHDGPVWDIVEVGSWGQGTGVLFATIQRAGAITKSGQARGMLLQSNDGGATWSVIDESDPAVWVSSTAVATGLTNWRDYDGIVHDRRRRIPAEADAIVILTQPETNAEASYFRVTL